MYVNVNQTWLGDAPILLNCRIESLFFKFFDLSISGNMWSLSLYNPIIEQNSKILYSWKNNNLSLSYVWFFSKSSYM